MGLRVHTNRVSKDAAALRDYRKPSPLRRADLDPAAKIPAGDKVELSEAARNKLKELAISRGPRDIEVNSGERRALPFEELASKLESFRWIAQKTLDPTEGRDEQSGVSRARERLSSRVLGKAVALENQAAARARVDDLEAAEGAVKRALDEIQAAGQGAVEAQAKRLRPRKTRLPMD